MSIKCIDIINSFKEFKVRAITKSDDGYIIIWNTKNIKYSKEEGIWDYCSEKPKYAHHILGVFDIEEFINKNPEECIFTHDWDINYDKLIGYVCWFWDRNGEKKELGILESHFIDHKYSQERSFRMLNGCLYNNCIPVAKDELKFYEEEFYEY